MACQRTHLSNFTLGYWSVLSTSNLLLSQIIICLSLLLFEHILTISIYHDVNGKKFTPDLNAMHIRDPNFVLRSEIFVHYDRQLQASHLILGCTLVQTSYQPFGQALIVANPLLSYIDVWYRGFFPSNLTVSEAWPPAN